MRLVNEMDSDHPMHHPFHVHGAGRFLVLTRNDVLESNLVWKDTVLVRTGETVDILLDVTNPGVWMAHCHIAEHHESGMMFSFHVDPACRARRATCRDYDVVVIGAGQAGLAIGHFLAQQGKRFVIVDAARLGRRCLAGSRWDSLVLFTPRRYDSLPGLPFPGDPDGYPTRDEVIAYLEKYAETFDLPIELGSPVRSLKTTDGGFSIDVGRPESSKPIRLSSRRARSRPRSVPKFAGQLASDVFQTHSAGYRNPGDVPEGTVLVVGGGNTGFQIAEELSPNASRSSLGRVAPDRRSRKDFSAVTSSGG